MISSQLDPKAAKAQAEKKEECQACCSHELTEVILLQSAEQNIQEQLQELREEIQHLHEYYEQAQHELYEANLDCNILCMQLQMYHQYYGGFMEEPGQQFFGELSDVLIYIAILNRNVKSDLCSSALRIAFCPSYPKSHEAHHHFAK
jgi:chromosome segregation ATPase